MTGCVTFSPLTTRLRTNQRATRPPSLPTKRPEGTGHEVTTTWDSRWFPFLSLPSCFISSFLSFSSVFFLFFFFTLFFFPFFFFFYFFFVSLGPSVSFSFIHKGPENPSRANSSSPLAIPSTFFFYISFWVALESLQRCYTSSSEE